MLVQGAIIRMLLALHIGHVILSSTFSLLFFFEYDFNILNKPSDTRQPHDNVETSLAGAYDSVEESSIATGTDSSV